MAINLEAPAKNLVSICQADLGLAERRLAARRGCAGCAVSICQADLGLAEPSRADAAAITEVFQSARQIWVWPNNHTLQTTLFTSMFQSARQIWVWPNQARSLPAAAIVEVSICQADLGLAELVLAQLIHETGNLFQSARQIWVWPNRC